MRMPRTFEDVAIFAAPGVFVVLWASGFIGAKLGLPYAEPLTFLALRMFGVAVLLGLFMLIAGANVAGPRGRHSTATVTGVLMHARLSRRGSTSRSRTVFRPRSSALASSACNPCLP